MYYLYFFVLVYVQPFLTCLFFIWVYHVNLGSGLADFKLENLITILMPMLNLTICNSFYNKIRVLDLQKKK